jgi:hypothetical protein
MDRFTSRNRLEDCPMQGQIRRAVRGRRCENWVLAFQKKPARTILWLLAALLLGAWGEGTALAQGYSYNRSISISHTQVPNADQADFPVLISGTYSYLATVANGGEVQNANGYDIIFTSDAAGTIKLDHEIESYNPTTGAVNLWVRITVLSHTADTVIFMQYGNAAIAASQENRSGVWGSSYAAIYHFADGGNSTLLDSSVNANALINSGTTAVPGQIGTAIAGSSAGYAYSSATTNLPTGSNPRTIEAWFKFPNNPNAHVPMYAYGNQGNGDAFGWEYTNDGNLRLDAYNVAQSFPWSFDTNWHHLVATLPPGQNNITGALMYLDGVQQTANGATAGVLNTGSAFIGVNYNNWWSVHGNIVLDEYRIATVARSADWITAEYNNQSSPSTFYAVGNDVPTITGLSPSSGAVGTSVTISGNHFGGNPGTVTFNGQAATTTAWSDTSITAVVPSGATTGNLVVDKGGVQTVGPLFTVAPAITSLTPSSGEPGASVTIAGNNFTSTPGTVTFNGLAAVTSSWSSATIVAVVPNGATSGSVVVTAGSLQSNSMAFTVLRPTITSLSPASGGPATSVVISGSNFGSAGGTVTFNGQTAVTVSWSDSSVVAIVPPSATTGNIVVHSGGIDSNGVNFTVVSGCPVRVFEGSDRPERDRRACHKGDRRRRHKDRDDGSCSDCQGEDR